MSRSMMNECYSCKNKRDIPGDCHVMCVKPSRQQAILGSLHGKQNGWFLYPLNFDPVWKGGFCENYEEKTK